MREAKGKVIYKITRADGCFNVRVCRPELALNIVGWPPADCGDCAERLDGRCRIKGAFVVSKYSCLEAALDAAKALIQELKLKEGV